MAPRAYTDEEKKTVGDAARARWNDPVKRAAILAKMKASGATRRAKNKLEKAQKKAQAEADEANGIVPIKDIPAQEANIRQEAQPKSLLERIQDTQSDSSPGA